MEMKSSCTSWRAQINGKGKLLHRFSKFMFRLHLGPLGMWKFLLYARGGVGIMLFHLCRPCCRVSDWRASLWFVWIGL